MHCSCEGKAEFSAAITPHDPPEIILICWAGAQETSYYDHSWKHL